MQIRVGITTNNLKDWLHDSVSVFCPQAIVIDQDSQKQMSTSSEIQVQAKGNQLILKTENQTLQANSFLIKSNNNETIHIRSLSREGHLQPNYHGELELIAKKNKIQVLVHCDLETYLRGVLSSEIPASYNLEAVKAQAVAARTYGLKPRIDHTPDGFNVCDSYLCCQYFAGYPKSIAERHESAITQTKNQILTFNNEPILALFSACAGGHTENYENCFSDPITGAFPPQPLPYLKGVTEGKLPNGYPSENALRELYHETKPDTCDSFSNKFRWHLTFSADQLEAHMHHVAETMLDDKLTAPFIFPPPSKKFGHIEKFEITKRGVAGTAISMTVHTSTGPWIIKKELIIRSLFKNPELNVARLMSARIFFDHKRNNLNLLTDLIVYGFGWGHGVGLQQNGAQGLALQGKTYKQILAHYFPGSAISEAN
ncbi:MAG: SpoIID/LytB domain-containing protein [Candidatus Obscuribacterales bacterium]|nr:SpoIID/LytB domain-containing protein [Candidatus Obscuribacterales bacterium]